MNALLSLSLRILSAGVLGVLLYAGFRLIRGWIEDAAFEENLLARPEFTDKEFVARHFTDGTIPPDVPIRLRQVCISEFGPMLSRVVPSDNLAHISDELDLFDLLTSVDEEFGSNLCGEVNNARLPFVPTFGELVSRIVVQRHTVHQRHGP